MWNFGFKMYITFIPYKLHPPEINAFTPQVTFLWKTFRAIRI